MDEQKQGEPINEPKPPRAWNGRPIESDELERVAQDLEEVWRSQRTQHF